MADAGAEDILRAADWLFSDGIQAVFNTVEQGGDVARVVGGAVRNTLLGHAVPDIDIATTALPDEVMRRAEAAGLKAIGTGIDHGTVTLISGGFAYEVTTLREDVETFGRQARVVYGKDWTKDAERRDFTLNALYVDRTGKLHDPLQGVEDCLARRVRFIGDPDSRIKEDYLRILRFFRIYAAYGQGEMDEAGLGACLRQRDGLRHLSAERIGHEVRRLLRAPLAAKALRKMNDCGLWEIASGGLARIDDYEQLRALDEVSPETRSVEVGLVVLAGFVREDLERVADRFRLSNAEQQRMKTAWQAAKAISQVLPQPDPKTLLYGFGQQGSIDGLLAVWARGLAQGTAHLDTLALTLQKLETTQVPLFPVRGADLIALGYAPGPELGKHLDQLEAEWRSSEFTLGKKQLLFGSLPED